MDRFSNFYLDGKPGRSCRVKGQEFLFFSGYNYLGINEDPDFNALVTEGISRFGWVFPSSRISNTRLEMYEYAEALLSVTTGSQATVLMPSGYAAGRMATSCFDGMVYNSPGSHPAILQNRPGNINFNEWKDWLLNACNPEETSRPIVLASDSLSPLTATINDFSFLKNLKREVVMVIDDSHGIGLLGSLGEGISLDLPRRTGLEYLFSYSLAKAFGISGGAVSCSMERAAHFRSLPEYTGVTPISPAQIYAFIHGQGIYKRQRLKLAANVSLFKNLIHDIQGISYTDELPVFVLPEGFSEIELYRKGIIISSFSYPDPTGQKINRIVINASHTTYDLERLAAVLKDIMFR